MAPKAEIIIQQYQRRLSRRRNWENLWQELADFNAPHRSNITVRRAPGQSQTDKLFDPTAINAAGQLAGFVHSAMTNPAIQWHTLKMADQSLNNVHRVQVWLDTANNALHTFRNQSNFTSQVLENYLDQVIFGTADLIVDQVPKQDGRFMGLFYSSIPIGKYVIEENHLGRVDVFQRSFVLTARQAVQRYGLEKVGDDIQKSIAENQPDDIFHFINSIEPRPLDEIDPDRQDAKNLPVMGITITQSSGSHTIIDETGFHEMPVMVPRWNKSTGEVWGRSPGMVALPDAKTLNTLVKLELKALSISVTPPILVKNDGILGKISMVPGKPTIVQNDVNTDIAPFKIDPRLDLSNLKTEQLQEQIRQDYMVNLLINRTGGVLTATEVLERIQEQQRIIGPAFGRQESELLDPMIDREFGILLREGQIPDPPPEILEAAASGEGNIDVQYEGPLARGQKSQEVGSLLRWMEIVQIAAGINPNVTDIPNLDRAVRDTGNTLGLPATFQNSNEDVVETRRIRAAAAEEQEQKQTLMQGAEALGKAAPALELVSENNEAA